MRNLSRRALFLTTGSMALLTGCTMFPGGKVTSDAIISLAGTVTHGAAGVVSALTVAFPSLIPAALLAEINQDIVLATQASDSLKANAPPETSANIVLSVEHYIQTVLNVMAAPPLNGLIPSPFNTALAALAMLLPGLTSFANTYMLNVQASASPAELKARAVFTSQLPVAMTKADAVAILNAYRK